MSIQTWCTFRLDQSHYGIDVRRVQEVLGSAEISTLPLAPRGVRGLINLRGQIVTALDLRVCLGQPRRDTPNAAHIVVANDLTPVSLLVDAIGDVERPPASALKPAPDTLSGRAREFVIGAVPLPSRMLLILHLERVLQFAFALPDAETKP